MKALLVYQVKPGQSLAHPLAGNEQIGRDASLPVCIDHAGVSRRHARITRQPDGWWIEDLGSTNGTFLNGQAVSRERLQHFDVVTLGKAVDLVFLLGDARPATAPPPRRPDRDRPTSRTRIDLTPDEVRQLAELREMFASESAPVAPTAAKPHPHTERPRPPRAVAPAPPRPITPPPPTVELPKPALPAGGISAVRLIGHGLVFLVDQPGAYILGRDATATLRIEDPSVSRRHARIVLGEDRLGITLEDAGSTNGTEHNGAAIEKPVPLANGDAIGLGRLVLHVAIERR